MRALTALAVVPALIGGSLLINAPAIAGGHGSHSHGSSDAEVTSKAQAPSIVDIAASNDAFSTLVAALKAADLVETLQGDGPFTVFAPTNEAFAALPEGTLETLLKPENKAVLTQILTYHVVPGKATSDMVETGEVATVEGSNVDLVADETGVMVDEATVIMPDIEASNGVIHVIDKVILPADLK